MNLIYLVEIPLLGSTERQCVAHCETTVAASEVVRILLDNRRPDVSEVIVRVVPAGE